MFAKTKRPASFEFVVRGVLVALSVRVIVAPTTAPPEESVTWPTTVPALLACEYKADGVKANRQHRATTTKTTRLLSMQLPPGWAMTGSPELCTPRPANCPKQHKEKLWKIP